MTDNGNEESVKARETFPHRRNRDELVPVEAFLIGGRRASLYQERSGEPLVGVKPDSYALFWDDRDEPVAAEMDAAGAFRLVGRLLDEAGGARAISDHDVVQVRPDAASSYRGCFGIVQGPDEGNPRDYVRVQIVLPVQGPGIPRILRNHVFERIELRRLGPAPFLPGPDPFPSQRVTSNDVTWTVNVPD